MKQEKASAWASLPAVILVVILFAVFFFFVINLNKKVKETGDTNYIINDVHMTHGLTSQQVKNRIDELVTE